MENFLDLVLSLRRNELDSGMRESHAELCQRAIAFIQDATDFIVMARQVRTVSLTERWEASKAAARAQRAVVEQSVTNAGAIEAQLPALHKVYGEARLAVQNYQPSAVHDRYSSAADLAEVQAQRAELEAAVTSAAEAVRKLEQQIVLSQGWASFENDKLNGLAAAEEALRVKVTVAADPDAQTFNSFGLGSGRPTPVTVADFGLSASQ
jgi:hypothetical protein